MKSLKFLFVAVLAVVFTVGVSAKNDVEAFNIEVADLGSASETAYTLSSDNFDKDLNVNVKHYANGSNYVVQCDGFELLYRVRGNKFGVTYLDSENAKVGKDAMYEKLNREEFLHQYVITDKQKTEKEYVALIAAYLPQLIK